MRNPLKVLRVPADKGSGLPSPRFHRRPGPAGEPIDEGRRPAPGRVGGPRYAGPGGDPPVSDLPTPSAPPDPGAAPDGGRDHPRVDDLIAPFFVREGISGPVPIGSLPGQSQQTVGSLLVEAKKLVSLGVPGLVLFGVPAAGTKDATGSGAFDPSGIVQRALSELKTALGDEIVLIADLCLDEYTDHGHCGVLRPDGTVDNDATLELYQKVARAQAEAGADVVAPPG